MDEEKRWGEENREEKIDQVSNEEKKHQQEDENRETASGTSEAGENAYNEDFLDGTNEDSMPDGEYRYSPKADGRYGLDGNHRDRIKVIERLENKGPSTDEDTAGQEHFYKETVKEKKEKKSKSFSFKKLIAACLVISVAGGGSIGAGYSLTQHYLNSKDEAIDASVNNNTTSSSGGSALALSYVKGDAVDVIKAVSPSVVSITTKVSGSTTTFFGNIPYEGKGAGSGVIFHEDDTKVYIVTNNHVIDGASQIGISITGNENIPASVVGADSSSDLAVISVLKTDLASAGIDSVTCAKFGDSDSLEVGESVLAIGNALGEGKSATGGMVSAVEKEITVDGKKLSVIQVDAAINPGNSGGALVNYKGEVVGINTAKTAEQSVEGMGYAIPSNQFTPIMNTLLEKGHIEKPYLGIVGSDITDDLAELYGLPVGVLIRQVEEGGSAATAGIQASDIITEFAGEKIMNMDDLVTNLAKQKVGDSVDIRIIRDGKTAMTMKVVIKDANA